MRIIKPIKSIATAIVMGLCLSCSAQSGDQENRPPRGDHKPPSFSELLKKMDANKDGKLARKEVKGPLQKDFAKVDANKDGFITEKELKKMGPPPRRKDGN